MGFLVGQSVTFEKDGVKGSGIIIDVKPGKCLVEYHRTDVKAQVECLDSEMVRQEDYRLQVQSENGEWTTLAAFFHEKDARRWISIIEKFTGERAIMVPVEWV